MGGGDIQSVSMDIFDPTKIIISLTNLSSSNFIINVFEMADLNGNIGENIFYQFDCNFNISIDESNSNNILYPNPGNGLLNLNLKENLNNIKIYNLQGKLLNEILPKGKNKLKINDVGFYFMEINDASYIPLIVK